VLRSYAELDVEDNPPRKGELILMFGKLAMCISPEASYGASTKTLWAVVGENVKFTLRDGPRGYQFGHCLDVDPSALTVTIECYESEEEYKSRESPTQKTFQVGELGRFDLLYDRKIYDLYKFGLSSPSDPCKPTDKHSFVASKGAILGALIGDAAGGILEFMGRPPETSEALNALLGMPGGGVFDLAPGQFTDDGEMTVTLLRTLCESRGAYRSDLVAQAYCQWEGSVPFDIGIATRSALRVNRERRKNAKGLAALVISQAAATNADSKANGSLMRATPLGIAACGCTVEEAIEIAETDCALTHPNSSCISATTAYVLAVRHLILNAADPQKTMGAIKAAADYLGLQLLDSDATITSKNQCKAGKEEVAIWLKDAIHGHLPPAYPQSGFVRIGFTYAFYYLSKGVSFDEAILQTLLQGGDTDTNACIVGGLIGASVGLGSLPEPSLYKLLECETSEGQQRRDEYTIKSVAKNLNTLCQLCLK